MEKIISILILILLLSCDSTVETVDDSVHEIVRDTIKIIEKDVDTVFVEKSNAPQANNEYYINQRLPDWFLKTGLLVDLTLKKQYRCDDRLNPLYLEGDFNGDGHLDIAISIVQIDSKKEGFAIIHGKTNKVFIIGAGTKVKKGLSDSMDYIDIWKVNREKVNKPGLDENGDVDPNGPLILENPSLQIEASEVGGGQIYWDGKEYAYFHQTC